MRLIIDAVRRSRLLPTLCGAALGAMGCSGGEDGGSDAPGEACGEGAPWAEGPALPLGATQETAVVSLDGKIYVLGGFTGQFGITDEVQIFDPASCAWSMGAKLPVASHHLNAAVLGDTIYVAGVLLGDAFTASGDTWSWAPSREASWSVLPSMPLGTERGAAIAGAIEGRIYIAGGLRNNQSVADFSSYDVVTQTWSAPLPPIPSARDHACGAVVGGALYFIGGRRTGISAAVHAYTPGGAWEGKAVMPTARAGMGCGVVGDEIVVVGGEGNAAAPLGVFPQVEAYAPATNTWRSLDSMRTPRHGMGAAGHDGKLYVPGGATRAGFGSTSKFEILTP